MSLLRVPNVGLASPSLVAVRARMASGTNWLYVNSERLWAMLSSDAPKKILFSGNPEWIGRIEHGFKHSPHKIMHGPITTESFQTYDIIVPLSLAATEEARRYSSSNKTAFPLPSAESVRLCNDKYELNHALIKAGFDRYIPKMAQGVALTPPYILKKRIGEFGDGCRVIRSHEDEVSRHADIADPQNFCQEFILGSAEFATHILFAEGRIVKALNIKYAFASDAPIKGQSVPLFTVVCRNQYLNLFARMLRTIQFEGLCCINYKLAQDQPFLLEINPRFGGSLAPYFFCFVGNLR